MGALVAVLLLAGAMVGISAAAVTTLYVDRANPACSNSGAGTQTQPFCTISAAASKVAAGQTVQVAAGTCPEAVTVPTSGTSTAPIVFTAAPGAAVTLSGAANGFVLSSRSWVTINGFNVTKTTGWGIDVTSSSHITISNNHITNAGQPASGKVKGGIRFTGTTDSLITGNTADHNSDYGILLTTASTRNLVSGNLTFNNAEGYQRAAAGIRQYSAPGNTIASNISHHNEDSGIESYTGSNNSLIYNNVTYANGDHGIDNYKSTGQRVFANSVYKNVTAGINVEGSSTGATLANNIAVDNGIDSPRTHSDIRIESGSTSGTTMDYDQVFLTVSDTVLIWNSTNYTTLSAFQSASRQESHGIQSSPRWASPTAGDFHLTASSPAIDSANSAPSGQPSLDVEGNARADDPATPNTGAGTPPYADRGAYEFGTGDAPPAARLTVTPSSGTVDLAVTADASASTDSDSTPIANYRFDFGDGTAPVGPGPGASAPHTYTKAGTYTVTVTVTDTAGLSSQATGTVTVTDAAPAAALTVTPPSGNVNLDVSADASGSTDTDSTPISSYRFDFGDGSAAVGPQSGATASHTYTSAGTYTVTVTVTDTAGLSGTRTRQVVVADNPPVAQLTAVQDPSGGPLNVAADASASTDTDGTPIVSYTFTWGDGSAATGPQSSPTASHEYSSPGTFDVKVKVTDTAGLSTTKTATVTVTIDDDPPAASLTVTPGSGNVPVSVVADASASTDGPPYPIATYRFDFGDGTTTGDQTDPTASHTYSQVGDYTVAVTVTDTAGLASTATATVSATAGGDAAPSAAVRVTPSDGDAPLAVTADASGSSDDVGIASYRFDFGDGSALVGPQAGASADHTYSTPGSYTVTVTVKDTIGQTSTATATVTVTAPKVPPTARLTVTPSSGALPLTVGADASASTAGSSPIATYRFDFGDGTAAVGPQPGATAGHTYTIPGTFTVTVTVTDTSGQTATAMASVGVSSQVNLVGNPGFETSLTGWNTASSSDPTITLTRVSGGHTGSWSARSANVGTANTTCTLNDGPNWVGTTSSGTYTGTLWVRGDMTGALLKLRFREYNGSTLVATQTTLATLTTSWQQVGVSITPAAPGVSTLDFNAYVSSAPPGTCFYSDDAAIVKG